MRKLLIGIFCLGVVCSRDALVFGLQTYPEKTTARSSSRQQDSTCVFTLFGDFLLGKLNTEFKASATANSVTGVTSITFVRHSFKPAFRAGFCLYFNKNIELFGQYLRQKNKNQMIDTSNSETISIFPLATSAAGPFVPISFTNGSLTSQVDDLFQTIDLLIKSRQLFNNGKVFVLPVIGLRGFLVNHKIHQSIIAENPIFSSADTIEKLRLIGLIVGADLKYIINRSLFFYGNIKTGAAAGTSNMKSTLIDNDGGVNISHQKQSENFRKFFDGDFGFATTFKLGHSFLGQFRVGVYMLYFETGIKKSINQVTTLQQNVTYQTIYAGASITF
jgi:hypothetical protein